MLLDLNCHLLSLFHLTNLLQQPYHLILRHLTLEGSSLRVLYDDVLQLLCLFWLDHSNVVETLQSIR